MNWNPNAADQAIGIVDYWGVTDLANVSKSICNIKTALTTIESELVLCKPSEFCPGKKGVSLLIVSSNKGNKIDKNNLINNIGNIEKIQLSITALKNDFNQVVKGFEGTLALQIKAIISDFDRMDGDCRSFLKSNEMLLKLKNRDSRAIFEQSRFAL